MTKLQKRIVERFHEWEHIDPDASTGKIVTRVCTQLGVDEDAVYDALFAEHAEKKNNLTP